MFPANVQTCYDEQVTLATARAAERRPRVRARLVTSCKIQLGCLRFAVPDNFGKEAHPGLLVTAPGRASVAQVRSLCTRLTLLPFPSSNPPLPPIRLSVSAASSQALGPSNELKARHRWETFKL